MPTDTEILILTVAAIMGTILSALLGWLDSAEPFNARKFGASVVRGIIAGFVVALGFSTVPEIAIWDYFTALLSGAGIDVVGHKIAGIVTTAKPSQ